MDLTVLALVCIRTRSLFGSLPAAQHASPKFIRLAHHAFSDIFHFQKLAHYFDSCGTDGSVDLVGDNCLVLW